MPPFLQVAPWVLILNWDIQPFKVTKETIINKGGGPAATRASGGAAQNDAKAALTASGTEISMLW